MTNQISFILNDQEITLSNVSSNLTLLDYIRLQKRLSGTKEGCAEGDCGACTILVGRLKGDKIKGDRLEYESVNSCICFVGALNATHIVTIEHLKKPDGSLHPVQQAMVDKHGSQCGFCTPGIVMSLYGLWMNDRAPNVAKIEKSLQGNLCRCTGYEPIIKAAQSISNYGSNDEDLLKSKRDGIVKKLKALSADETINIERDGDQCFVPSSLAELKAIRAEFPNSTIVAGSTDVGLWVTKHMRNISPTIFISHLDELKQITVNDNKITIGAGVTYSELTPVIAKHIPQMNELWHRIGGEQVRNMGTIGGNIANGSPIGDTPPPLIALGAELVLDSASGARKIKLEDFFIDYGKQDRETGDFVREIIIPIPNRDDHFAVYKISKRRDEDISAVCAAFHANIDGGKVKAIKIAFGGMAATPKRAEKTEKALLGLPWNEEAINQAVEHLKQDYQPISDCRATADYRMLVAQNLLRRFYLESQNENQSDEQALRLSSANVTEALA